MPFPINFPYFFSFIFKKLYIIILPTLKLDFSRFCVAVCLVFWRHDTIHRHFGSPCRKLKLLQNVLSNGTFREKLQFLASPGQSRPVQASPGQSRPIQASPGPSRPVQASPGQSRPVQASPQTWNCLASSLRLIQAPCGAGWINCLQQG